MRDISEAAPPPAEPRPAAAAVARRLYRATLALLRASDDPVRDRHYLLDPLSQAVAWQQTRDGQQICASLATALAEGDHATAIDACGRLIDLAVRIDRTRRRGRQARLRA